MLKDTTSKDIAFPKCQYWWGYGFWFFHKMSLYVSPFSVVNTYVRKHTSKWHVTTGKPARPSPSTFTVSSSQMIIQLPLRLEFSV